MRGPENLGTKGVKGIELNAKITPTKKVVVNGDFNYNSFERKASWQNQSFNFKGNNWSSEITSKFKFSKDLDIEMSWNCESRFKTIDGESAPSQFLNLGARKKILKGKGD